MKLKKNIVFLPGDGIGPEVARAARVVLQECGREFGHQFELSEMLIGGAAIDKAGNPLPNETLDACRKADAIFPGRRRRIQMGFAARGQTPGKWPAGAAQGVWGCM